MTFEESATLINDPTFRGRVKVAALVYAQYLSLQPNNSSRRSDWIFNTLRAPDIATQTLTPSVVINPNVQQEGASVTDPNLQAAVQMAADTLM